MSIPRNEPAFPVESVTDHDFTGMSLRDYFAQASPTDEISDISYRSLSLLAKEHLAGMKMPRKPDGVRGDDVIPFDVELATFNCRVNAAIRYMMAEAMIRERSR